jgi:hypothetical protein
MELVVSTVYLINVKTSNDPALLGKGATGESGGGKKS